MLQCSLYVQPGAKCSEFAGLYGDLAKIRLRAPAVDGLANRALIAFMAEALDLPVTKLRLLKGEKSRIKTILLPYTEQALSHPILGPCLKQCTKY